jgi:hypothetical protein
MTNDPKGLDRTTLACDDGNGNVVHSEEITYSDFPPPGIDLYCEGPAEQRTIMLPSEH